MRMKELTTSNIALKKLWDKSMSKGWAVSAIGSLVYFILDVFGAEFHSVGFL